MSRRRIHFAPLQKPSSRARLRRASGFLLGIAQRIERKQLFTNRLPHPDIEFVQAELKSIVHHLRLKAQNIRRKRTI